VYHSLYAYFDRDNVALPGMAAFFKAGSEEEREHAELLMEYQNVRGGRVRLASIIQPEVDFNHAEKVGCCGSAVQALGRILKSQLLHACLLHVQALSSTCGLVTSTAVIAASLHLCSCVGSVHTALAVVALCALITAMQG
jgi:hypothetical protein